MKNFRNVLVICALTLSGCAFSGKVWEPKFYKEDFKSYFIDEGENKVVLVGENKFAFSGKENYYYYIISTSENIKEIFELGEKTKDLKISFGYTEAKGFLIESSSFGIGFDKKNLSISEIDFLYKNKFVDAKVGTKIGRRYKNLTILRYPSSNEIVKQYKLIPITKEEGGSIWEKNTPLQTTGKVIITPFTLAIDIILLPITIPYFIYSQVKESKTDHFCEGEFCGYDKIRKK